jgi:DNA-binding transcriptional LysR family regulator
VAPVLPSLESLRCFVEAAHTLNFRAAARAVALTPSALGQRIRQLEDQLGQELFVRSTRRVRLTRAGGDLVPYAERALAAAGACARAARGEMDPAPVDLVVGTRHELGMSFLLPLLPALAAIRPGLALHLYFGSSTDLLVRVRSFDIDCAVGSMRITDLRLEGLPLHREEYVFVGEPRLLAKTPLRRPEDASAHTLVDAHADLPLFAYLRDGAGGSDRLRFARVVRMGTIDAIRACVLRGVGVAVLPRYFVARDLARRRLAVILPKVVLQHDQFRLIFRRDDARRGLFEELAARIRAAPLR